MNTKMMVAGLALALMSMVPGATADGDPDGEQQYVCNNFGMVTQVGVNNSYSCVGSAAICDQGGGSGAGAGAGSGYGGADAGAEATTGNQCATDNDTEEPGEPESRQSCPVRPDRFDATLLVAPPGLKMYFWFSSAEAYQSLPYDACDLIPVVDQ